MYYFQPFHTLLFAPHDLLHKFTSKVPFILNQHNKHLYFLAEIHFGRPCKHAHMQPFKDSAQYMALVVGKKGSLFV
jgi:hypothetical protein